MRYLDNIYTKDLIIALFNCNITHSTEDRELAQDILDEFKHRRMSQALVFKMADGMGIK